MLTLYGVYRSRASRNYWLVREMGIEVREAPVMQAYRLADPAAADAPFNTQSPEFLKINPNGLIPALDDDGAIVTESLAINLYIARKFGGPLAAATLAEEGKMLQWTLWAVTEVEPHAMQILYNRVMRPVTMRDPKAAEAAIEALRKPFTVLDAALAADGHLVGGRFTVADINVAEVARYCAAAPELLAGAPRVKAWLEACHARPAFKAMMARREAEPA